MNTIKAIKMRKISGQAQAISYEMQEEYSEHGATSRWNALQTLYILLKQADGDGDNITYEGEYHKSIIIRDIPSLVQEEGLLFDRESMRGRLLGMSARYGADVVHVLITHNLNSAVIYDLSELMWRARSEF